MIDSLNTNKPDLSKEFAGRFDKNDSVFSRRNKQIAVICLLSIGTFGFALSKYYELANKSKGYAAFYLLLAKTVETKINIRSLSLAMRCDRLPDEYFLPGSMIGCSLKRNQDNQVSKVDSFDPDHLWGIGAIARIKKWYKKAFDAGLWDLAAKHLCKHELFPVEGEKGYNWALVKKKIDKYEDFFYICCPEPSRVSFCYRTCPDHPDYTFKQGRC